MSHFHAPPGKPFTHLGCIALSMKDEKLTTHGSSCCAVSSWTEALPELGQASRRGKSS